MEKTDYYQQFSETAKDRVKAFVLQRDELVKKIRQARKNLSDGQGDAQKFKDRIDELKKLKGVMLTDEGYSFDKYRTSLKKLIADFESCEVSCDSLAGEVIPQLESELKTAEMNVKNLLGSYLLECRKTADQNIQVHLNAAMDERESYVSAFRRIYTDNGETLVVNSESLLPGAWLARENLTPAPMGIGEIETPTIGKVENAPVLIPPEQPAVPADNTPEPVESKENDDQTSAG